MFLGVGILKLILVSVSKLLLVLSFLFSRFKSLKLLLLVIIIITRLFELAAAIILVLLLFIHLFDLLENLFAAHHIELAFFIYGDVVRVCW